ncbi:MAG: cation:proton antiporter [Elusimicrobia bacterium]|nr:cation:proton antiporter [Elusimicrobiota bacterium]
MARIDAALTLLLAAALPTAAGNLTGVKPVGSRTGTGQTTVAAPLGGQPSVSLVQPSLGGQASALPAPASPAAAAGYRQALARVSEALGEPQAEAPAAAAAKAEPAAVEAAERAVSKALAQQDPAAALSRLAESLKGEPSAQDVVGELARLSALGSPALRTVSGKLAALRGELGRAAAQGTAAELLAAKMDQSQTGRGDLASPAVALPEAALAQKPGSRLAPAAEDAPAPDALFKEVPARNASRLEGDDAPAESLRARVTKFALAYGGVFGISMATLHSVNAFGQGLVAGGESPAARAGSHALIEAFSAYHIPLLLLQLGVIIGAGKLFGWLLGKVGQPSVVGQVIGGLALGPSLLGLLFPGAAAALFPEATMPILHGLSTVGLASFMFIVGQELDLSSLKKHANAAGLISHASIFIPFAMGAALALALFSGFAPAGVAFLPFALFIGISMSITAFPVLAHILHERGMTNTPLGSLALACAAIDDISGWTLLAVVLAVAGGGTLMAAGGILGSTLLFAGVMFGVVRPLLARFAETFADRPWYKWAWLPMLAAMLAASALTTELIGVHSLFGAFVAGMVVPRGEAGLSEDLAKKIQAMSAAYLLPVFFALTGLRTQLDILSSPALWGAAALVIATAVAGKFGGGAFAARYSGLSWRDSFSIGALMNTRGLMELVVLNIGYERGIINGPLFAIFVLMAVGTTMMTGPFLSWFGSKEPAEAELVKEARQQLANPA